MIEERFTDEERQLLAVLASREYERMRYDADPFMEQVVDELENVTRKLSGEGVRLVARRV